MTTRKYIILLDIRRRLAAKEAYEAAIMRGVPVKEAKAIARAIRAQSVTDFAIESEAENI